MSPKALLRIAAIAIGLFDLGHTVGGMILAPSHGPEEDALMASLAAYKFDMTGSMRSHADFYAGEGWYLSAVLTALLVITWMLSSATLEATGLVKKLSVVLALFFAVSAALCFKFFFIAPLTMSIIAAVSFAAAAARPRAA
jgi:hypothetical protein